MPICFDINSSGHNLFRNSEPNCVDIGIVNNMPDAALEATERQYAALLREAAADDVLVRLTFYALPEILRGDSGKRHVSSYSSIGDLLDSSLDALIVTGAEPRTSNIRDEAFWGSLTEVLEWAEDNTYSAVLSCLAAQAGVLHIDGIRRRPLAGKRCGIFACPRVEDHDLTSGTPALLRMPHSRWNEIPEEALRSYGYRILSRSVDAGVDTFVKQRKSLFVFLQGHPEYEADTLLLEYRRDIRRFLKQESDIYPAMPKDYFSASMTTALDDLRSRAIADRSEQLIAELPGVLAAATIPNTWRSDSVRIYRNWLAFVANRKETKLQTRTVARERAHVAAR